MNDIVFFLDGKIAATAKCENSGIYISTLESTNRNNFYKKDYSLLLGKLYHRILYDDEENIKTDLGTWTWKIS